MGRPLELNPTYKDPEALAKYKLESKQAFKRNVKSSNEYVTAQITRLWIVSDAGRECIMSKDDPKYVAIKDIIDINLETFQCILSKTSLLKYTDDGALESKAAMIQFAIRYFMKVATHNVFNQEEDDTVKEENPTLGDYVKHLIHSKNIFVLASEIKEKLEDFHYNMKEMILIPNGIQMIMYNIGWDGMIKPVELDSLWDQQLAGYEIQTYPPMSCITASLDKQRRDQTSFCAI